MATVSVAPAPNAPGPGADTVPLSETFVLAVIAWRATGGAISAAQISATHRPQAPPFATLTPNKPCFASNQIEGNAAPRPGCRTLTCAGMSCLPMVGGATHGDADAADRSATASAPSCQRAGPSP
jgi:hypothetical protein